jgi:hypothetical protein
MALNKWDKQHLINLGLTQKQIDSIFDTAVKEAAAIGVSLHDFNPDKPFSFADYPKTKARLDKLLKSLQNNVETAIVNGVRSEWTLANNKNNALCDRVFGENKYKLTKEQERRYYSNNGKAHDAFIARKTAGLNLSDRVWNYTSQFKSEIEMGLDLGIRNGLSAAEMARDLKQYLKEPDSLYRRFRFREGTDEAGNAIYNKKWKQRYFDESSGKYKYRDVDFNDAAHKPGQGVYRSSYKNAMRLARTENNMAYRTSDHERWQQLDFVVGIEIWLSNNHTLNGKPFEDICDELQGKYLKDFKFTGWHPQCRCHAISILKTTEELAKDNERILNGEEPETDSDNMVKDVPKNFKEWITDNADRIAISGYKGTTPYFLLDNDKYVNLDSFKVTKLQKFTVDSRREYLRHDVRKWRRDYFNRDNGGYLTVDKQRIEHSKISKNEKEKFAKEYAMSMVFAQKGYKIEMLRERPGLSSSDITINGIMAELKKTSSHNNILKYVKKATRKQGAEIVLFEFEKNTKEIQLELLELQKTGIKVHYFFTDNKNKIYTV